MYVLTPDGDGEYFGAKPFSSAFGAGREIHKFIVIIALYHSRTLLYKANNAEPFHISRFYLAVEDARNVV